MKERIFTTKEQGRVLVEAGLPISTAIGFRDKYLDSLHSMECDVEYKTSPPDEYEYVYP